MSDKEQEIIIQVNPQGKVEVKARGFAGGACRAATKPYEEKLGVVTQDTPTAEAKLPDEKVTRKRDQTI